MVTAVFAVRLQRTRQLLLFTRCFTSGYFRTTALPSIWTGNWMNEADTRAELIEFCRQNNRVCPQPMRWNDLYHLLPETHCVGNRWEPALPLILGAWHYASNSEKMLRLEEHINWAANRGAIQKVADFLRGLEEADWHHLGD